MCGILQTTVIPAQSLPPSEPLDATVCGYREAIGFKAEMPGHAASKSLIKKGNQEPCERY